MSPVGVLPRGELPDGFAVPAAFWRCPESPFLCGPPCGAPAVCFTVWNGGVRYGCPHGHQEPERRRARQRQRRNAFLPWHGRRRRREDRRHWWRRW